jgi:hypothetical protein
MKQWILAMALILAGHAYALSGHLDMSKLSSGTVSITSGEKSAVIQANGDWTLAQPSAIQDRTQRYGTPRLSWASLGRVARMDNADASAFQVDAYTVSGKCVASDLKFNGNYVTIPGNSTDPVYLKLKQIKTQSMVAARSMVDSTVGVVYIIVTDPNGTVDTLREVSVTDWSAVIGTKYIVQRNVDVVIPTQYDGDTVKCGYYNIYTNPANYYSTVLGRYHAKQYSGFVYSAYDSASFAGNGYLYSALAIVKNAHDSVVAFTTDLDTVTAKVGNFGFDSTRFGTGILSVRADSLTIPWYAFNVTNGTSVTAYKSVVKVKTTDTASDAVQEIDVTDTVGHVFYDHAIDSFARFSKDTNYTAGDTSYTTKLVKLTVHVVSDSTPDTVSVRSNECSIKSPVFTFVSTTKDTVVSFTDSSLVNVTSCWEQFSAKYLYVRSYKPYNLITLSTYYRTVKVRTYYK